MTSFFLRTKYQIAAIAACVILSLAMIANNQLGGEAMWFWYATVFHQGTKLYSQLHIALQPLYILELNAWMRVVGSKLIPVETLSLLHVLALCLALFLILRESDWPDATKAFMLLGAFCITVSGHSYRFDDYHVIAESLIFFALYILLVIARTIDFKRLLLLAAALGIVTALTITSRLTDGAALLAAALICLSVLVKKNRPQVIAGYLVFTALVVLLVVSLTGDTFSDYISNSLFHAAASKGGSASIFAAPFHMIYNTLALFRRSRRHTGIFLAIFVIVPYACRFLKNGYRHIFGIIVVSFFALVLVTSHTTKTEVIHGAMISTSVLILTSLMYLLPFIIAFRWYRSRTEHMSWDPREVLVVLALTEWASYAAGAAAEPLTNYYAPVALLLLLVPTVALPYATGPVWWKNYAAAFMTILTISSISNKIVLPYSWQNYTYGAMFEDRTIYHHPVYGTMYINKDLLTFSEAVCADIGSIPGKNQPELLSLPYPFPNYFCATPPWHNYVQTFFDTSTRATIEHLMVELNTAPPRYIVYQRQLNIMVGAERLYNHGQPLAQRDLDKLISDKLQSGQWSLVESRHYLELGEGWFIIRTHA